MIWTGLGRAKTAFNPVSTGFVRFARRPKSPGQFAAGGGGAGGFVNEFGAFLDVLGHDADGDFLDALGVDADADGTGDAAELFGSGDFFLQEMLKDGAGFARAADHAEKPERPVNPVPKDEGIVAMTPGDDEREGGHGRRGQREQFFPDIDTQRDGFRKVMMIGERGAVVENGHVEIQLSGERRGGLGYVAGASDPEGARRRDGFSIEKCGLRVLPDWQSECGIDCRAFTRLRHSKIIGDSPGDGFLTGSEVSPKFRPDSRGVGENYAKHFAAANQAVVPAEIVVEQEIEGGRLASAKGVDGALLDFSFETTTTERAVDAAIGIKQGLGADFLRAGTFDAGDERESDGFAVARGVRERVKDDVLHARDSVVMVRSKIGDVNAKAIFAHGLFDAKPQRRRDAKSLKRKVIREFIKRNTCR